MNKTFGDVMVGAIDGVFELNVFLNQNTLTRIQKEE